MSRDFSAPPQRCLLLPPRRSPPRLFPFRYPRPMKWNSRLRRCHLQDDIQPVFACQILNVSAPSGIIARNSKLTTRSSQPHSYRTVPAVVAHPFFAAPVDILILALFFQSLLDTETTLLPIYIYYYLLHSAMISSVPAADVAFSMYH